MRVRHFYHVYAAGAWAEPVNEHIAALVGAGFSGQITVGLVGPPADRAVARKRLASRLAALYDSPVDWVEQDVGYEQVTLAALRDWVRASSGDAAVLYAHTKGAHDNSEWNSCWRRSMTRRVVGDWRRCVGILSGGYDTVGCHWLTSEDSVPPSHLVELPFYGGNFWWATADYLRRLPSVAMDSRFDAETWIGRTDPRAYDLLPGWPTRELLHMTEA